MKHAHRSALGARLPSAWLLRLRPIPILLVAALCILLFAGPAAASAAAPSDNCTWNGGIPPLWSNGNNWSCGHVPQSDDDVTIGSVAQQPFLNAAATVAALKLDGGWLTMNGSGSLTVTGAAEVTGQSHITNDGQYSAASTTVQTGAELIAGGFGTFDGPFTVQLGATLEPAPGNLPSLLGDLTNYGTLKPTTSGGSFSFKGQNLVNDGQAETFPCSSRGLGRTP
jgi:hypothetical protein